jgi:eukaryotic-like serine/threonine-protein kinase
LGNPNTLAAPTETTAAPPNPIVEPELVIDRYELFRRIGQGGMASVHLARQVGGVGFSRVVAVKRLHSHLAASHEFVALFLDEARLAARVRHQNVVSTLDVVERQDETLLVMEYVEGATLSQLAKRRYGPDSSPSLAIVSAVFVGALRGLHAAHEARSELGAPLHLVHRDISPQNIIVGTDGVPRLLDFGVAKAQGQLHTTLIGALRGKLAYMAPEHIRHGATKASDVYRVTSMPWPSSCGRHSQTVDSVTGRPQWRS